MRSEHGVLAVALLALACGDGENSFDGVTWQSAHVHYHSRAGDPQACEDVVAAIERRSDTFAALLEASPSRWEPIEYYKYFDMDDANRGQKCEIAGRACAKGRSVYTPRAFHDHELAHVFYAGLGGEGPPFLEEGFAVGLTCDPSSNALSSEADLESALQVSTLDGNLAAGQLVSALWFAGSPAQFFELEARLGTTNPSVDELARQVNEVYGESVQSVWDTARTVGPSCIAVAFCGAPSLELGETTLLDRCDGRDARLVSPALAPALGVQVAGAPVALRACAADAEPSSLARVQLGGTFDNPWRTETWFVPPASDYALFQVGDDRGGAETRLRTRALTAAFTPQCDLAAPTALLPESELSIFVPLAPGDYHFTLSADVASMTSPSLELSLLSLAPSALQVRWCGACVEGAPDDCQTLELSQPRSVELEDARVLAVQVKEPLTASTLLRLVPQPPERWSGD